MNEVILKAGRRGRLRYTPEQKQALVEACETSGLSCPRLAALHGVNYQSRPPAVRSVPSSSQWIA